MLIDFNVLWRYFAWTNQTLAAITLWACAVYVARHGKAYVICLIPAIFMTIVVVSYILFAPTPEGFGLPLPLSLGIAAAIAAAGCMLFVRYLRGLERSFASD